MVNKIAAGEIIIAPVNALKELMENSIDAGSTTIDILVKEGGIKMLQLTDNGSGINKDDLVVLCERFTTSKLATYEDLNSIQTYGFRGEALASISHIARLSVTTKTKDDPCAWKVSYSEGRMVGEPKPTAGKDGTMILVEDLFYNVPSRLRALRSGGDEFSKILDVVGRYAVHSAGVGFSCKKFGDSQFSLTIRPQSSTQERIRSVFSGSVATNLIEFEVPGIEEYGVTEVRGQISNLNFNNKKSIPAVFFINNRLVSCDPLRRSLNQIYSTYLPKGNRPFIYLSLLLKPELVDVNVHPTKREVRFLHEDEIIETIANKLHEELSKIDTSRAFKTASILTRKPAEITETLGNNHSQRINEHPTGLGLNRSKKSENKLVRIDSAQTKITSFLRSGSDESNMPSSAPPDSKKRSRDESFIDQNIADDDISSLRSTSISHEMSSRKNTYKMVPKERTKVNLTSIKTLRKQVDESMHKELTNVFANMTYIGVVDETRRLASMQYDLKLFIVDYAALCNELFYQIGLTDFANFGKVYLKDECNGEEGVSISQLLSRIDSISQDKVKEVVEKLWEMREMLEEYFSIELEGESDDILNAKIKCVPLLLKDYMPPLMKLPFFIYRLGTKVDWFDEMGCLGGILKQIALFYIPEVIEKVDPEDTLVPEDVRSSYIAKSEQISSILEHVVFPSIKRRLLAPRSLLKDVVEVADLPGLYKVFERC